MTNHKPDCKMSFGRKDSSCPRCQELIQGAPARDGWQKQYFSKKKKEEADRILAIRNHNCTTSGCAPICVAFDW